MYCPTCIRSMQREKYTILGIFTGSTYFRSLLMLKYKKKYNNKDQKCDHKYKFHAATILEIKI